MIKETTKTTTRKYYRDANGKVMFKTQYPTLQTIDKRIKETAHKTKWQKAKHSLVAGTALIKLFLAYGGKCIFCGHQFPLNSVKTWSVEHIIPQSWFAENNVKRDSTIVNTAIACKACNSKRGNNGVYTVEQKMTCKIAITNYDALDAKEIDAIGISWSFESIKFAKAWKSNLRRLGKLNEVYKSHGIAI